MTARTMTLPLLAALLAAPLAPALAAQAPTVVAQATQPKPQPQGQPQGQAAAPAATAPAAEVAAPVDLTGFRSARFGMDEAAVRAAIASDFGKPVADKIARQDNLAEKTTILNVGVPDLFEGAGVGTVSYVFGYKSKKLIQVAVAWSKQSDPAVTPEQLFSGANILQGYFLQQGYVPSTVVSNAAVDAGILIFRGADKDGNTAMLLLQGAYAGDGAQRNLTPNALLLYYIDDAKNPDVFRIPAGKF